MISRILTKSIIGTIPSLRGILCIESGATCVQLAKIMLTVNLFCGLAACGGGDDSNPSSSNPGSSTTTSGTASPQLTQASSYAEFAAAMGTLASTFCASTDASCQEDLSELSQYTGFSEDPTVMAVANGNSNPLLGTYTSFAQPDYPNSNGTFTFLDAGFGSDKLGASEQDTTNNGTAYGHAQAFYGFLNNATTGVTPDAAGDYPLVSRIVIESIVNDPNGQPAGRALQIFQGTIFFGTAMESISADNVAGYSGPAPMYNGVGGSAFIGFYKFYWLECYDSYCPGPGLAESQLYFLDKN